MGAELLDVTPDRRDAETAVVFVHGFGGDAAATWGAFPEILRAQVTKLADWAIYSLGYQSTLAPDLRGVWAGDPGIDELATYLRARTIQEPLKGRRLALVAHSMGGLVVQKALVTHPEVVDRTTHVLLYGTPSGGLEKSDGWFGRLFKRQTQDMGLRSEFIPALRLAWQQRFGDAHKPLAHPHVRPFRFWTIAGDRDEFVPASSSLGPFAQADRLVVPGNHLEIVKPKDVTSMSVQAAVDAIVGDAAPGGPWNAARVAVEIGDFQQAIRRLEPNADDLDEPSAVALALALDSIGRRDDAVGVLEKRRQRGGTDAMGTLTGRFKRIWWSNGTETPARKALELYQLAYELSVQASKADQAFYHGINVAFMTFAFERDPAKAATVARDVLGHCAQAKRDVWCLATIGEANLYLGDKEDALAAYQEAVATRPEPWQMKSIYEQALRIADALDDDGLSQRLEKIFRGF